MSRLTNTKYYIQSSNIHLLNILEENYYMELGVINIKILNRLLSGEMLELSDFVYYDILNSGIGKITSDVTTDIYYQLNYLLSLRQKSSTYKFFLTVGTINYRDEDGCEKYAPIVLIPIEVDYQNRKIITSADPVPNRLLMRMISKRLKESKEEQNKFLDSIYATKINNAGAIDRFCLEIANQANLVWDPTSYMTICKVEYYDFNMQNDFFTPERSIYEMNSKDIINNYFNEVFGVLPTNIHQKHVVLKVVHGESFGVDGRLGSGKTYTILNIISDFIAKRKRVLYVNQDLDNIWDVEKNLRYLGLDGYLYNFTKNMQEVEINPVKLPPITGRMYNDGFINNIANFEKALSYRFRGYSFPYVAEQLAILNNTNEEIKTIIVDAKLEKYEIDTIYNSLLKLEEIWNTVDYYPTNIWNSLQIAHNNITVDEVISRTKNFYNIHQRVYKSLNNFCDKYQIKMPSNIHDMNKMTNHIFNFSTTKPLAIWKEPNILVNATLALREIQELSDINYHALGYYKDFIKPKYKCGRAKEIIKIISADHIDLEAIDGSIKGYINRLLSDSKVISLNEAILDNNYKMYSLQEEIKKIFNINEIDSIVEEFLFNLLELLDTNEILDKWIELYINDNTTFKSLGNEIKEQYSEIKKIKTGFINYFNNNVDFSYHSLHNLLKLNHLAKPNKKIINLMKIKDDKKTYHDILLLINNYDQLVFTLLEKLGKYCDRNDISEDHLIAFIEMYEFTIKIKDLQLTMLNNFFKKYLSSKNMILGSVCQVIKDYKNENYRTNSLCIQLKNYAISINEDSLNKRLIALLKWQGYLVQIINIRKELPEIFLDSRNIKIGHIIQLADIDEKYIYAQSQINNNKKYYKKLLGHHFNGFDTIISDTGQTIEHFGDFIIRLQKTDDVDKILNEDEFKKIFNKAVELRNLFGVWIDSFRQFSLCFKRGKAILQEQGFEDNIKYLEQHIQKLSQVENVMMISKLIEKYQKHGLLTLSRLLENGEYKGISKRFLYTVLTEIQETILQVKPELSDFSQLISDFQSYELIERDYCTSNILMLQNQIDEKRNRNRFWNLKFNDYNNIINTIDSEVTIFLADLNILNSDINLSLFDLVIIDDGHLSSANKYNRIVEAKQVIIFGDRLFQSSVSNTLMQRISENSFVNYRNRYVKMSPQFNNQWSNNNQYIYTLDTKIITTQVDSISQFAHYVVDFFEKNNTHIINVLISNERSRRLIYSCIVEYLRLRYSHQEIIQILCYNIRITNANNEGSRYVNDVMVYYNDFLEFDTKIKELIFKNYIVVSNSIHICYISDLNIRKNQAIALDIKKTIGKKPILNQNLHGINKVVYDRLKREGLKVEQGFGRFDIIIFGKVNIGIIMEGKINNDNYSLLDSYLYHGVEYSKRGWRVKIFYTGDLITCEGFEKVINEIITLFKKINRGGNK